MGRIPFLALSSDRPPQFAPKGFADSGPYTQAVSVQKLTPEGFLKRENGSLA